MAGYLDKVMSVLVEDEVALDVYCVVGISLVFVMGAVLVHFFGMDRKEQVKRRAWVITTCSALFCFLCAVYACNEAPISWDFRLRPALMGETSLTRFIVHFFRAQAVLDLVLGVIFYRTELHFLTSVFHHVAYFLLCNWMLNNNCSMLFIICCLEEFPTFLLGLGHLNKAWRTDMRFGISYGLTRVVMHTYLVYQVFSYPEPDPRLSTIRFNFGLTWFLHTHWFYGWVQQQRRRWKDKSTDSRSPPGSESKSPQRSTAIEMNNLNGSGGSRSSSTSSKNSSKNRLVGSVEKIM